MSLTSAYYSQFIADDKPSNTEFSFDQERRWKEGMNKIGNHSFSVIFQPINENCLDLCY